MTSSQPLADQGATAPGVVGATALQHARREFAGAPLYADCASQGLLSIAALEAAVVEMEYQTKGEQRHAARAEIFQNVRSLFAQLIGAEADEIAITRNVSEGLNAILHGFPWAQGDNVIVCPGIEHQAALACVLGLRSRGIEIRSAVAADGVRLDFTALEPLVDTSTRMIVVSHVSFLPGLCCNLEDLSLRCRERGIFLLVDAAQSAGLLEIDVRKSPVGALCAPSGKGLLGLPGCGFLYCSQQWSERIRPIYISSTGLANQLLHVQTLADGVTFAAGSARFHLGTPNWVSLASLQVALTQLIAVGPRIIEMHVIGLARALSKAFQTLGYSVRAGTPGEARSHIVSLGMRSDIADNQLVDEKLSSLALALKRGGVRFSVRRGMIRFSFHLYNDLSDVQSIMDISSRGITAGK